MREEKKIIGPGYAMVGGGVRLPFSYSFILTNRELADNLAIARAKNLNCPLYYRDEGGNIFQLYPERFPVPRRSKVDAAVYPEMLSCVQSGSEYSNLSFV